ncbi:hypothetical protein [Streptomyces sp. NPDC004520]|uniref:hypothetical protein n=1 Tax=unclassified Streptomyces TaxID=2593676 RepID=UPI0036BDFAA0
MSIRRKLITAAGTIAATASLAFLGAGPASAGGNGQQLNFHDSLGTVYSISAYGINQNGEYITHCFYTPNVDNALSGWWWKGNVHINFWTSGNCTGNYARPGQYVWVEPSQADDWVYFSS